MEVQTEAALRMDSVSKMDRSAHFSTAPNAQPAADAQLAAEEVDEKTAIGQALSKFVCMDSNVYLGGSEGRVPHHEDMPCECRFDPATDGAAEACGEACINRMLCIECDPKLCAVGEYCSNQRIQKRQHARVELFKTRFKGLGVRTLEDLPRGALVFEYCGEVLTRAAFKKRARELSDNHAEHFYFMSLTRDEIIDASYKGSLSRFINHSCHPNCETQKWIVHGFLRIGIFTRRPIAKGDELSFDYKFERYGLEAQKCHCGEVNCRGVIGSEKKPPGSKEDLAESLFLDDGGGEEAEEEEESDADLFATTASLVRRVPSRRRSGEETDRAFAHGMEDAEDVTKLVKAMVFVRKERKIRRILDIIETTERPVCLRKFINLHGVNMLKLILIEYKGEPAVVRQIFRILQNLPIATKNTIQSCHLEKVVREFENHYDFHLATTSRSLLESWSQLQEVYRIPKAAVKQLSANGSGAVGTESPGTHGSKRSIDEAYYNYSYEDCGYGTAKRPRHSELLREQADRRPLLGRSGDQHLPVAAGYSPEPSCEGPESRAPARNDHATDRRQARTGPSGTLSAHRERESADERNKRWSPCASHGWSPGHTRDRPPATASDRRLHPSESSRTSADHHERRAPSQPGPEETAFRTANAWLSNPPWDERPASSAKSPPSHSGAPLGPESERSLPPNWQVRFRLDGSRYHYNAVTFAEQEEAPAIRGVSLVEGISAAELQAIKERAAEFRSRKQQTGSASSGQEKQHREAKGEDSDAVKAFRASVSDLIVKKLSHYKHQLGTDKFKHTARKLTHMIVEKETKDDELPQLTPEVKKKVKKFIYGYFEKMGLKQA